MYEDKIVYFIEHFYCYYINFSIDINIYLNNNDVLTNILNIPCINCDSPNSFFNLKSYMNKINQSNQLIKLNKNKLKICDKHNIKYNTIQ